MYTVIYDRIFWIYFIITIFFIIIGVGWVITSSDPGLIIVATLWLLSNIVLMILVYNASVKWAPIDPDNLDNQICVVDSNSQCFDPSNRVWLLINILFIILLIVSILWAGELKNADAGPLRTMAGVIMLLGGLILTGLSSDGYNFMYGMYTTSFWISVSYLIIWFGLTFYVVTTSI